MSDSFFKKHQVNILLAGIMLTGLFLRLSMSLDPCLHMWDERFHALVAKNTMEHMFRPTLYEFPIFDYDYKKWYANHIWLHKQPLPIWLIAICYKIFGLSELVTRLPSLVLSTFSIWITFILGSRLFNRMTGLLSAFFISINGLVIEMTSGRVATDHYDLLFLAWIQIAVLLALLNAQKQKIGYAVASGVFIGFAVLTKWLPALVVLPVHICFLINEKQNTRSILVHTGSSLLAVLFVAVPWQVYISTHYPLESAWSMQYNLLHFTSALEGQKGGLFYFFDRIRINYSEIVYIPLFYYLFVAVKTRFSDKKLLALIVWIFVPLIFFSLAKTKMQGYVLFIAPALFIITAEFFWKVYTNYKNPQSSLWKILRVLFLICVIALPLRYCFERTWFGFKTIPCQEFAEKYKQVKISQNPPVLVLNVENPIEFMFYNNCTALSKDSLTEQERKIISDMKIPVLQYDEKNGNLRGYQ